MWWTLEMHTLVKRQINLLIITFFTWKKSAILLSALTSISVGVVKVTWKRFISLTYKSGSRCLHQSSPWYSSAFVILVTDCHLYHFHKAFHSMPHLHSVISLKRKGLHCSTVELTDPPPPLETDHKFHETYHPLHFIWWKKKDSKRCCDTTMRESIHTKDESKRGSAFAFIFGVNWPVQWM